MSRLRVGLLVAGTVLAAGVAAAFRLSDPWLLGTASEATVGRVETPGLIPLGAQVNGVLVQVPIRLTNLGGQPVTVGEFHTDCACIQIYQVADGVKQRFAKLAIAPGEVQTIFADLRVSGDPGLGRTSTVQFRELPDGEGVYQVHITYIPVARLYTIPQMVVFGEVPAGTAPTQRVELRSDGSFGPMPDKVTSTKTDQFALAFHPAGGEQRSRFATENPGQHLIGHLDLTLRTGLDPGAYDEPLVVLTGGRELIRLPVSARGVASYELAPSALLLPRVQGGRPVYEAKVLCRSRSGAPFQVAFDKDALFEVGVSRPGGEAGTAVVTVRFTGDRRAAQSREYKLRLRVKDPQSEVDLVLPVEVQPDES